METRMYYLEITPYVRRIQKYLRTNGIACKEHYLPGKPLTLEQLHEILRYTTRGVDEILATRSKAYLELKDQGLEFDELTISGLLELFRQHPTVLRTPILVGKHTTIVGYNEDEMSVLKSKTRKQEAYRSLLQGCVPRGLVS